ncbi:MAG: aldehyde dehydrogenase family protein, partial [Acidimicrobiia bacterium]|nr:aldehyde dehydrogenase family protein [Acidimicrobiia bacterium]
RITSHNPRTGEQVGEVVIARPEDVRDAVAAARKAAVEWAALGPEGRKPHLKAFKGAIVANLDHIVEVVQSETGKHNDDVYLGDISPAVSLIDYYIRKGAKLLAPQRRGTWPFPWKKAWVERHPRGVAGVISPWNYPFGIPIEAAITALVAGNTVVVKPSDVTPLSGQLIADLAEEAGLPEGVVQVVHGRVEAGEALIDSADIVHFTGSPWTAKSIAKRAAETLTPVILELGGKDAMVVLDDANLDRAAKGAVWGSLFNAGQTCVSVERIYADEAIYDKFLAKVEKEMDKVNAGAGDGSDIGAIIGPSQLDVIERHLSDAVAKGARIVTGGLPGEGPGQFFEPTLVVNVDHTMDLMTEETFGPVMAVMKVRNEQEALELANDSRYGLHGSVWSRDKDRRRRFASAMRTGTVAANDVMINYAIPSLPFGGIGESGYGSNFGPEGLDAFTYPKAITDGRVTTPREAWWFPRVGGRRVWRTLVRAIARK